MLNFSSCTSSSVPWRWTQNYGCPPNRTLQSTPTHRGGYLLWCDLVQITGPWFPSIKQRGREKAKTEPGNWLYKCHEENKTVHVKCLIKYKMPHKWKTQLRRQINSGLCFWLGRTAMYVSRGYVSCQSHLGLLFICPFLIKKIILMLFQTLSVAKCYEYIMLTSFYFSLWQMFHQRRLNLKILSSKTWRKLKSLHSLIFMRGLKVTRCVLISTNPAEVLTGTSNHNIKCYIPPKIKLL